ncbi:MAG: WD repeat-containing protein [Amphiamblys sp. WSBS2006]|nr:MAG: WD repeat-containing protein [Amphiamblys sp. WSBS2006]
MGEDASLTDCALNELVPAKVFSVHDGKIDSLDIHSSGEWCLTGSSGDRSLNIYSCIHGTHTAKLFSKDFGIAEAKFTHKDTCLVYAATEEPSLLYHSTYDNKYLARMKGHVRRITQTAVSPADDFVATCAPLDSLRLWDLRTAAATAVLPLDTDTPLVCFDPEGLVFCLARSSRFIHLYDMKNYQHGPFLVFDIQPLSGERWTAIEHSSDGKKIAITATDGLVRVVDAFEGNVLSTLRLNSPSSVPRLTPDSRYLMAGSQSGALSFWSLAQAAPVAELAAHRSPITRAVFNPRFFCAVTAAVRTVFWLQNDSDPLVA